MGFNNLSDAEAERLAFLLEELGETQQAIGKILRHGYENYHPDFPGITNRKDLCREIGDVCAAIQMMMVVKDIEATTVRHFKALKLEKVKEYLHHQ